jgi:hypothetical protein
VGEYHRVVVDVHDPRLGDDPLGDLMDVLGGRQPRTDVEELPDPVLPDQPGHGPPHEVPVVPDVEVPARIGRERRCRRGAVGGVVVLAPEEDVIDARRVRLGRVHPLPQLGRILAESITAHGDLPSSVHQTPAHQIVNNLTPGVT